MYEIEILIQACFMFFYLIDLCSDEILIKDCNTFIKKERIRCIGIDKNICLHLDNIEKIINFKSFIDELDIYMMKTTFREDYLDNMLINCLNLFGIYPYLYEMNSFLENFKKTKKI